MSLAINPVNSVLAQDPRIDPRGSKDPTYVIEKGAQLFSTKRVPANAASISNANWNATPPSQKTYIDRKIKMSIPLTLKFTGTSVGPTLLQIGQNDALRFHPLNNALINSISVSINNSTVTQLMSETFDPLMRYNNYKQGMHDFSTSPSMQDQSQEYTDMLGANRNPLGSYQDGLDGAFTPRGEFTDIKVISDDGTTATVECLISEYIFVSPLTFGMGDECGLIGISQFEVVANFNNGKELKRVWSHNAVDGENITDIDVQMGNTTYAKLPELHFNYLTPRDTQLNKLPKKMTYSYYNIERYPRDFNIAANTTSRIMSDNIQVNSVPKRIYLFARKKNGVRTFSDTDSYLPITGISLNWNNLSGQLGNADSSDLYEISRRNGLEMSYSQWRKYIGSVLCLDFSCDVGLHNNEAPGVLGNYQMQIDATFENNTADTMEASMYIIAVYEGVFCIADGNTYSQLGVVDPKSVLTDPDNLPLADYSEYKDNRTFYGGGFLEKVKKFGKKALPYAKKAAPMAARALEFAFPETAPAVEAARMAYNTLVGSGYTSAEAKKLINQRYGNGILSNGVVSKGVLSRGGRSVPRKKLQSRLMNV